MKKLIGALLAILLLFGCSKPQVNIDVNEIMDKVLNDVELPAGQLLDDELLERVDKFTKKMYTSRSGLISIALASYMNSQEVIYAISDMSLAIRKIADQGEIDDETMQQLKDFERMSQLLLNGKQ